MDGNELLLAEQLKHMGAHPHLPIYFNIRAVFAYQQQTIEQAKVLRHEGQNLSFPQVYTNNLI